MLLPLFSPAVLPRHPGMLFPILNQQPACFGSLACVSCCSCRRAPYTGRSSQPRRDFCPVDPPSLAAQIPALRADLPAGLVACLAAVGLAVFIKPRTANLHCHNHSLLHKNEAAVIHRRPVRSCHSCPCHPFRAAGPASPGACPGWAVQYELRYQTGRASRCSSRSRSPRL